MPPDLRPEGRGSAACLESAGVTLYILCRTFLLGLLNLFSFMKLAYYPSAHIGVRQVSLAALLALSITVQSSTPQQTAADVSSPPQTLELGKVVKSELRGGQGHEYRFNLPTGQYARLEINQKSIDLDVAAFGPDGKQIFETDVTAAGELETASLISAAEGQHSIRLKSTDNIAPTGEYEITLVEVQPATEANKSLIAGERARAAAAVLYRQQNADAMRSAIQKHLEALQYWRAAGDAKEESATLSTIGTVYKDVGEKQKALEYLNQGLQVARTTGDKIGEAWALDGLGNVYQEFGDKKQAVGTLEQALTLWRATGHRNGELNTLNNLGVTYYGLDEKQKMLEYFEQARAISHDLHNQSDEASLLNNLAAAHGSLGNYAKDLELETVALDIQRQRKDRDGQAIALNNMGYAYSILSQYQKAMDAYTEALTLEHDLGARKREAITLNNMAWVYSAIGDKENAIKSYTRSAEISRQVDDSFHLGLTLGNLGANYAELHDYKNAVSFNEQALPLHRKSGNRNGEALTLNNMGLVSAQLGEREKAIDYYRQSLSILRTTQDKRVLAQVLRKLGALSHQMGDAKALEFLNESVSVSRLVGDRKSEAESLGEIARLKLDQGDLEAARKNCDDALAILDSLRSTITNPSLRAWFSQAGRKVYEVNLQTLLRLHQQHPDAGYDGDAFVAAEKARARSLLELLGESQAQIREGVDTSLLDREIELRRTIASKAQRQERLLGGKHKDEEEAAAAKELDSLTREYDQLQSTIRKQSPAYAALTMPVPLTLEEIRRKVLDADTVLLEYSLGEEKSFLFSVTLRSIDVFDLPKRETVEAAARRVYDLLIARNLRIPGETAQQRMARVRLADTEYQLASAELSRMVVGPAARKLGNKRLLIIAEGALQYVPFTGLPDPQATTTKAEPLLAAHEMVTAPSASVLALIRADVSHRKPAEKVLAVLADPVFDNHDSRIAQHDGKTVPVNAASNAAPSEATRSASESGVQRFERLRFSRREAEQIARLVNGPEKFTALDFAASRVTATSAELAQYRIVHFATHGIINNQHPELSGLVLSLVDEKGDPVDGFLRLYDIYNLKLGADLVVLSACQTALGKEMAGEGLIGLTRGFVYAGAPRVVASLWRIDDRVTAELMGSFYSSMLTRGERPAAALRAAQLAMWKTAGWSSPYYWAAFTLQGEWK